MPDMKTQTINGVVYNMVDQPGRENLAVHMNDQSNPHMVTAAQVGAPTMDYAKKVGAPYNLLDNSDFRNPVNQRGQTEYTYTLAGAAQYTIDRWNINPNAEKVTLGNDGVTVKAKSGNNCFFRSNIDSKLVFGKTLTLAVKLSSGTVIMCAGEYPTAAPASGAPTIAYKDTDLVSIFISATPIHASIQIRMNSGATATIEWAALYEGEYTAETLPEYQPKGYAAEFLECQRYYRSYNFSWKALATATRRTSTSFRAAILLPMDMRVAPTCSITNLNATNGTVLVTETGNLVISDISFTAGINGIFLTITLASATDEKAGIIFGGASGCYMHMDADL